MTTLRKLLPCLLLLAACSTSSALEISRDHARLGDFSRAYEVLDELRDQQQKDGGTVDPELEKAHHEAKMAFLLWRARQRIFGEREDDALVDLATLAEMAPDYPELEALRQRALTKKAKHAVDRGDEFLRDKELDKALACYIEAERSVPGYKPAVEGSDQVNKALSLLSARAQSEFLEAVRRLPEFRFVEVRWHSANSLTNDPTREDAKALRARAQREIAQSAFARGEECERKLQFGAALVEFRAARRIDKELPGVDDAIANMEREVQASQLVEKAQAEMRNGSFDAAREHLGRAFEKSVMTRGTISELMILTRRKEGEARYQVGRDFEILGKKAEALAAFEALSKDWPDGLSDEKARIDGLRADIEGAQREWDAAEAAEQAGELQKALDHYQGAERFYAGWKDGKARIERLRQQLAQAAGG